MASQDRHRWRSCAQNTTQTARNDVLLTSVFPL